MHKFYSIDTQSKIDIFNQIAEENNIPAYAVEKDWWVVQTLSILFNTEIGSHLIFKGGTSLSKAWNIIERFSEDIDMAVDRSFLGFEGDLSKRQRTKLRKAANVYITTILFTQLQDAFTQNGLNDVRIEMEEAKSSDEDPTILYVYYPNVTSHSEYVDPRVKIEIGCRSLREPFEKRDIISLVDETYTGQPFTTDAIQIPTVLPERTFLEKVFLLHEEFQRPSDKIRADRLSRHLYDIYQLSQAGFAEKALNNKELYETIVNHRLRYTKVGGVDYNLHQPQTINPVPIDSVITDWEKDYKTMQEEMIHGVSPTFDDLIAEITKLKEKINSISWTINLSL